MFWPMWSGSGSRASSELMWKSRASFRYADVCTHSGVFACCGDDKNTMSLSSS
jgi:hypothetical protein